MLGPASSREPVSHHIGEQPPSKIMIGSRGASCPRLHHVCPALIYILPHPSCDRSTAPSWTSHVVCPILTQPLNPSVRSSLLAAGETEVRYGRRAAGKHFSEDSQPNTKPGNPSSKAEGEADFARIDLSPFPIIGIGASAGGIAALGQFSPRCLPTTAALSWLCCILIHRAKVSSRTY